MSWLKSILLSLNENELNAVKSIKLIGQEKKVLDWQLNNFDKEIDNDLLTKFEISSTHYYKINSVLIKKILAKFSDNFYERSDFLRTKNLYAVLKSDLIIELKQQQKLVNIIKDKQLLLYLFRLAIDFPFSNYNENTVELIEKEYLSCFKNEELLEQKTYIKFHKFFSLCNRSAIKKNPQKSFGYTLKDLFGFEKELIQWQNYLALYYLYRTFCSYYVYYEKDVEKNIEYLTKAIGLKEKIKHHFPIDLEVFLNLLLADAYLLANEPKKSFDIYSAIFDKGVEKSMYGYYYHCEQYCTLATQLEQYQKAIFVLENCFKEAIEQKNDVYATRGLLAYCKLNLITKKYKEALSNIVEARKINDKSVYLPFDLQIRVLETFCFFLKDDFEFTKSLCVRNIKFINAQETASQMQEYLVLFKLLNQYILAVEKKKNNKNDIVKALEELDENFKPIFGNLLSVIIKKINE
ncbi:MAG: hypothetical protein V4667_08330 [Bacteroidota bacterium]